LSLPQFPLPEKSGNKSYLCYQNSLSDDYELVDDDDEAPPTPNDQELEQKSTVWSEIPLNSMSESNSSESSYSQNSEQNEVNVDASGSGEKESKDDADKKQSGGLSDWLSKSSFRRQSLEDVFAQSTLFGKFGRSLERRNSESEVEATATTKKEFFLFNRHEGLTDSQVENLFLPPEHL
jgi:hypothetical protein